MPRARARSGKKAPARETRPVVASFRVTRTLWSALVRKAQRERRDPTELVRIIVGERLIADGYLPPDAHI